MNKRQRYYNGTNESLLTDFINNAIWQHTARYIHSLQLSCSFICNWFEVNRSVKYKRKNTSSGILMSTSIAFVVQFRKNSNTVQNTCQKRVKMVFGFCVCVCVLAAKNKHLCVTQQIECPFVFILPFCLSSKNDLWTNHFYSWLISRFAIRFLLLPKIKTDVALTHGLWWKHIPAKLDSLIGLRNWCGFKSSHAWFSFFLWARLFR